MKKTVRLHTNTEVWRCTVSEFSTPIVLRRVHDIGTRCQLPRVV